MSQDQPNILASPQRRYYLWGGGAVVLVAVLMLWVFYRPRSKSAVERANTAEDSLAVARQTLNRGTDLASCRNAIQEINRFVEHHPQSVTPFSSQEGAALAQRFGLDASAVAEMSSPSFTLLDGWHLHQCLQFRDAAKALLITNLPAGPDGKVIRQGALDRAVAGFDWVMREMRFQEHNGPLIPPLYALRRGWGTGLERGLVFLELLRQLGPADELQGCLVYCPDKQGGAPRFWACGVIVENGKAVYLFDPRLGLALPGPDGKGIATLTQVSKDPTVLAQLNRAASKADAYDVEPDQATHAEIQQVCHLSALAPRMRFVEETLQASAVRVRLAVHAEEEAKRLTQASGTNSCRAWRAPGPDGQGEDGPGLVRRFLPPLEGGTGYDRARATAPLSIWPGSHAIAPRVDPQLQPVPDRLASGPARQELLRVSLF